MRPAGKARDARIWPIFEWRVTQPGGMQRRSNAAVGRAQQQAIASQHQRRIDGQERGALSIESLRQWNGGVSPSDITTSAGIDSNPGRPSGKSLMSSERGASSPASVPVCGGSSWAAGGERLRHLR